MEIKHNFIRKKNIGFQCNEENESCRRVTEEAPQRAN